jgi:hypothetical protein
MERWQSYVLSLTSLNYGNIGFLTEMSTGNIKKIMFLGHKVRTVGGADNFTAIYEPIV